MSDNLPPSGKIINEMLDKSGISDALHDVERNDAASSASKGRPPYKLQSSSERAAYFAEDALYAWWRLATWWLPRDKR